jgi:hypothetical protein
MGSTPMPAEVRYAREKSRHPHPPIIEEEEQFIPSKEKLPLYLKEMEFRYNHRGVNLFQLFAQKLCELEPF